jgi:two-component system OmpR family sensor kinase
MRLSVGTRWTLRYSLAMLVTVVILALLVYDRVERRIQQDAELLLDLQVQEVVAALERYGDDRARFEEWLDQKTEVGDRMVDLGVALFDERDRPVLAKGVLAQVRAPLHPLREVRDGFYEVDLGRSYPHYVASVPMQGGTLQVAIYSRPFARRAGHIGRVFQIAIPAVLILTLGFGWWLTRRSLKPIAEITESARRITGAHLEEWIPTAGTGDELDRLAETLNEMMARIRDGMERSREFQTRLARELRAPLLALQREIAALADEEGISAFGRRRMHRALDDAEALAEAVHALLRLAWSEAGRVPAASIPVPLGALVRDAASNVAPAAERRGVMLSVGPVEELSVSGDPFWLHQLFASVTEAAVASAPSGGMVAVRAERDGGAGVVSLRSGARPDASGGPHEKGEPGVASAARLALAREIARAHGGSLESEPVAEGETLYRLRLPA